MLKPYSIIWLKRFGIHCLLVISCLAPVRAIAQLNSQIVDSVYQQADLFLYTDNRSNNISQKAILHYRKVIELYEQAGVYDLRRAECHEKIGNILESMEQYAPALEEYRHVLRTKQRIPDIAVSAFFMDYISIGSIHCYLESYDSAEYYFSKAEHLSLQFKSIEHQEWLFNSTGFLYFSLGNYKRAISYYTKALSALNKDTDDYDNYIAYLNNNIAVAQARLGNYAKAIELYRDVMQYDLFSPYFLYLNLGEAYEGIKQYDSATYFLKKALDSREASTQLITHNILAKVFLQQNQMDSARLHFEKSIAINKEKVNGRNINLAASYTGLAQIASQERLPDSALYYYQQALIQTMATFNDTDVTRNPDNVQGAVSLLYLFKVLKGKAQTFYQYYRQDQDTAKLTHSLACYQAAIRLAKHIQKSYDSDDAKLFFVEHIYPVFEEALAPVYALYELTGDPQYVKMGLAMAEASKASVLSETLKDVEIKTGGVVNDSLVKDEKRLKQKITSLRIRLAQSNDAAQNLTYQESLTDLEIALARTIKTLQKDEKYYQLKYQEDSLDLTAIQRQAVGDGAVALEYVTCQDFIYIFLITDQKTDLKRIRLTPAFEQSLQQVQNQLYDYQAGRRDEGQQSTTQLYRFLIEPYEADIQSANRLIIIPDGRLSYIPFEILSAEATPRRYLIQDYTCNYAYSATLLLDAIRHRKGELENTVLAMAPFAGKDRGNIRSKGFNLLAASRQEVEQIGGSIYLENRATKRLFLKMAGSYGILHLATHASVNSENPLQSYIAFYPDQGESDAGYRLYTQELYNLKLDHVKLVVLSACEAGSGQVVQGEGVISLARAFAYAGCPNIVTTLWKADDRSAAEITTRMHRYLKSGYAKDKALRLAKLDYLNSDIHPILKSPYYWANFIFIGDPAPIYSSYTFIWYMLAGVLAAALLVYGIRRYVRVRTGQVA